MQTPLTCTTNKNNSETNDEGLRDNFTLKVVTERQFYPESFFDDKMS